MIILVGEGGICPCGGIYKWLRAVGRDGDCTTAINAVEKSPQNNPDYSLP